jgi:hypothetical protein
LIEIGEALPEGQDAISDREFGIVPYQMRGLSGQLNAKWANTAILDRCPIIWALSEIAQEEKDMENVRRIANCSQTSHCKLFNDCFTTNPECKEMQEQLLPEMENHMDSQVADVLRLPTVPEREIPPTTTHPYQVATCCSI